MITINNTWIRIALLNFLIVAVLGTFLRFAFIRELFFLDYLRFQNAHWHLALFGWVYQAMYAFIIGTFLTSEQQAHKKYQVLFWLNQILIIIVFITLITNGYSFLSVDEDIAFLFLIGFFVFLLLKDLKNSATSEKPFSVEILKIALFFLFLSFIGILSIIPTALIFSAKRSVLHYLSNQFFMHFQYNGWFIFGILSLFFRMIENYGIQINIYKFRLFKWLLFSATLITYFLSIYWGYPGHLTFLWIVAFGGVIQFSAFLFIRKDLRKIFAELKPRLNPVTQLLFKISYASFIVKLILQIIIAYPPIANVALTIRNYSIAYFHLVFLCITSLFLIAWNNQHKQVRIIEKHRNTGIYIFSIAILLVELLLFFQGTLLWMGAGFFSLYYELIFLITLCIPIGIFIYFIQNFNYIFFTKKQHILQITVTKKDKTC